MAKPRWLSWTVGEISKLRDSLTGLLAQYSIKTGFLGGGYKLDSSKVDVKKARALYDNTDDAYKLGAGFAKPVINTTVGFMGVPTFKSEDEDAQAVLDDFFGANVSRMQETHRNALRDGDCYVWITREETEDADLYPEAKERLVYNIILPEMVEKIVREPVTGKAREYILLSTHTWLDEAGNKKEATIRQFIGRKQRKVVLVRGDMPPEDVIQLGEQSFPWNFIPIVHFKNEGDTGAEFGKSDLEPIEPFLKAYHDVMLAAIQGSKMHSTPRLKLRLKNVAAFLQNNFGVTDPKTFAAQGGTIKLDGKELLIFQDDEDAEFIEVKSAIGSAEALLKFLFYCIVDTSETPEFAFGVHTPSSLSSVQEQMPILVRRIARKREHFTESWQLLARIVLAMTAQAEGRKFATYATTLDWDEIDPRDEQEVAATIDKVVNALVQAVQNALLSQDAAVEFLKRYIDTMNDWISDDPEIPGERERILQTKIRLARMEDGQLLNAEAEELKKIEEQKAALQKEG